MANLENNQKLSEIEKIKEYTEWPTSRNFSDPCWLESKSLLMSSETIESQNKRKSRALSTRFTYGDLFELVRKMITTMISGTYRVSGKFDFVTYATNMYCDNASTTGRNIINYSNLKNWLDKDSGFRETLAEITYGDNVNPKY